MATISWDTGNWYTTTSTSTNNYSYYSDVLIKSPVIEKVKKPVVDISEKGVFQYSTKKFKFDPEELVL